MCHHHCFLTLFSSNMPLLAPRPTTRHDGGAGLMGATAALAFINVRCPVTLKFKELMSPSKREEKLPFGKPTRELLAKVNWKLEGQDLVFWGL